MVADVTIRGQGRIITWNDERGFGFIAPDGGGQSVFVHISSFTNRQRRPERDEPVTYELSRDDEGRLRAKFVAFIGDHPAPPGGLVASSFPPLFAIGFLFFVGAAALFRWLPRAVLVIYLVASVLTFLVYAFDKSAAERHQWRIAESTLHLLALVGGWPGSVAAQQHLRHKSSKRSFQFAFWVTVVINCAAFALLMSPHGTELLRQVLRDS